MYIFSYCPAVNQWVQSSIRLMCAGGLQEPVLRAFWQQPWTELSNKSASVEVDYAETWREHVKLRSFDRRRLVRKFCPCAFKACNGSQVSDVTLVLLVLMYGYIPAILRMHVLRLGHVMATRATCACWLVLSCVPFWCYARTRHSEQCHRHLQRWCCHTSHTYGGISQSEWMQMFVMLRCWICDAYTKICSLMLGWAVFAWSRPGRNYLLKRTHRDASSTCDVARPKKACEVKCPSVNFSLTRQAFGCTNENHLESGKCPPGDSHYALVRTRGMIVLNFWRELSNHEYFAP